MTDSVTSNGLTEFIAGLGGKHFRYRRGYKNVIGQGVKLNQQGVRTELMMETRSAFSRPCHQCLIKHLKSHYALLIPCMQLSRI